MTYNAPYCIKLTLFENNDEDLAMSQTRACEEMFKKIDAELKDELGYAFIKQILRVGAKHHFPSLKAHGEYWDKFWKILLECAMTDGHVKSILKNKRYIRLFEQLDLATGLELALDKSFYAKTPKEKVTHLNELKSDEFSKLLLRSKVLAEKFLLQCTGDDLQLKLSLMQHRLGQHIFSKETQEQIKNEAKKYVEIAYIIKRLKQAELEGERKGIPIANARIVALRRDDLNPAEQPVRDDAMALPSRDAAWRDDVVPYQRREVRVHDDAMRLPASHDLRVVHDGDVVVARVLRRF